MNNYLFINRRLDGTGGSKVIIDLCNELVKNGHEATILVDDKSNCSFYIDPKIKVFQWKLFSIKEINVKKDINKDEKLIKNLKSSNLRFISLLKEYLYFFFLPLFVSSLLRFQKKEKFTHIINNNIYSYNDRHLFLNLLCKNYFVNFHNSLNDLLSRERKLSILPIKFIFKKVQTLCVSYGILKEIQEYNLSKIKPKVIYNMFDFDKIKSLSLDVFDDIDFNYILSVGTLSERKNFSLGINVFYELSRYNPNLHYVILGDGHLKNDLLELIESFNLSERVHILGFKANPYKYIKRAKCLVLTSLSEGLPTVLIESLILGTPVVSTNCPTGPDEILYRCRDLSLVELGSDVESNFQIKIQHILDFSLSENKIRELSDIERFKPTNILNKWELL